MRSNLTNRGYRLIGLSVALAVVLLFGSCNSKTPATAPPVTATAPPKKGKTALIIVDMQNDLMPGGPMAVEGADNLIPIINQLQDKYDVVVASQNWHAADHSSFSDSVPAHCVQDTPGAELATGLNTDGIKRVFQKGKDPKHIGYSAFFEGDFFTATGMGGYLQTQDVTHVSIVGVATEGCVKNSTLDALQNLKFNATLIQDAIAGRDQAEAEKAIGVLTRAGVHRCFDAFRKHHVYRASRSRHR